MQKKQVSVIDIGSSKITAAVGERGVNGTFLIKGRFEYLYDGYADGEFFDVEALNNIIALAVKEIKKTFTGKDLSVYVGVPGAFTEVVVKDSQLSFNSKKRIKEEDINDLFDAAFVMKSLKHTVIGRSAIVYEIDDGRRLANPVGSVSALLKGRLSFVICDNYFIDTLKSAINNAGVENVEFVSSTLAQALYLIDPETRDRIAMCVDVGHISTTFTIVQGDGILYQNSFAFGGGYITAALVQKFNIEDFETAETLKRKVNLCSKSLAGAFDLIECGNGEYYESEKAKSTIMLSLDNLCEQLTDAMEKSGYIIPEYVPMFITGGGISYLRGAKEHVSNRLGTSVSIVAPNVPLMDKPTESSFLSLLDFVSD